MKNLLKEDKRMMAHLRKNFGISLKTQIPKSERDAMDFMCETITLRKRHELKRGVQNGSKSYHGGAA